MAEDEDRDDATEDPSQRRLDEARAEGQIPLSREAVTVATLATTFGLLSSVATPLANSLVDAVRASTGDAEARLLDALTHAAGLGLVVIAGGAAAAIAASLVQTGGGFWPQLAGPRVDRLFSVSRLTHAVSREGLVDTAIAAAKALALLGAAWLAIEPKLHEMRALLTAPTSSSLARTANVASATLPRLLGVLLVLGAVDVFLVRRRYMDRLKMKREDLKREVKEEEGDPHIKARRKRRHRDLAQGRVAVEVPRADAIVVNPTHIAVAIRYRRKHDRAPRVTAKGKGHHAQIMRELAAQHGVPIVRDVPLARLLVKRVKVGHEVPAEAYRACAAVLAYVHKVTGRVPGTGPD
jgi:flagellar biosynthesis protein FlhB